MMTWKEERQRAYNSLKLLNTLNPFRLEQLSIHISGTKPAWKTVYRGISNASEGFRTWREVAIFLSGIRVGVNDAILQNKNS